MILGTNTSPKPPGLIVDEQHQDLADEMAACYADPLRFVRCAFDWSTPGSVLAGYEGPDYWQEKFLKELGREVEQRKFNGIKAVPPIRMTAATGHGTGKSTLVAWLVMWAMSTRPGCQGTVTANTFVQLETKTWAQIRRWAQLCITAPWFTVSSSRIAQIDHKSSWFFSAQTCREENSEAFAGQHAASSSSIYIFDEASAVPDKIFEVSEGGLTDGEPMIFCFGNPTRNTGKFYRINYGSERDKWVKQSVDSRQSQFTNKELIQEWEEQYGEDSDFFRVRVRGLPPYASELQFISSELIYSAQKNVPGPLPDEPLIAGFDASGGGSAWNVVRFRRGNDAVSRKPIRLSGEQGTRQVMVALIADVLAEKDPAKAVTMMFVDSAFGSPIVERLHALGHKNVMEVSFGDRSPDHHQENMRSYMWYRMREWLKSGAIDPNDDNLAMDLAGPGYHINKANKVVLEGKKEMQKRGVASPDDGDALALTFAQNVALLKKREREFGQIFSGAGGGWMT